MTGMLLGDKSALPPDVKDDFRRSGLYHLLAVSGLHVGFLFALFTVIISPFALSLRTRRLILSIVLWGYVFVTGANPPTLRAALMISLLLMSYELKRVPRPWNLWGSAALLILLFAPDQLFKPGFQLSFAAMAGVLLAMDIRERIITRLPDVPVENLLLRRLLSTRVVVPLLISICAVIFTAPFLTWHFGGFAPVSIILNLLAIPLAGTIFGLAWITILIKIVFGFSLTFLVSSLGLCLRGLEKLAHLGSHLPGNAYADYGGVISALILLGILLGIVFSKSWKRRAMCVMAGLILLLLLPLAQSSRELKIEFLDVGQGDATLLRFPGGQNLLIDCGSVEAARFELISSFRRRGIDRIHNLLISHFDEDHAGGALELLEALRVDRILVGANPPEGELGKAMLELVGAKNIPIRMLSIGDTIAGMPGTSALILWPPRDYLADDNRASIVLKIGYGESDILFTGDISTREEKFLLAGGEILQSDVLKVAHHGSKFSSSRVFLERVHPEVAVVSCGRRNIYGHPARRVLRDLREIGADVHRTDREYAGVFASDRTSIREVSWR